jgi:hypothetical protein
MGTCDVCGGAHSGVLSSLDFYWYNPDYGINLPTPPNDLNGSSICRSCYKDGATMETRIRTHKSFHGQRNADTLDFWCPREGDVISNGQDCVLLKIPKVCCGFVSEISPTIPGDAKNPSCFATGKYCVTHRGNYVNIWNDHHKSAAQSPAISIKSLKKKNTFSAKRVIAPNGLDGLICFGCGDFHPYVEPNCEGGYNCPSCR